MLTSVISSSLLSSVYFIALILSLSQQMTSDRISLYRSANQTLWWGHILLAHRGCQAPFKVSLSLLGPLAPSSRSCGPGSWLTWWWHCWWVWPGWLFPHDQTQTTQKVGEGVDDERTGAHDGVAACVFSCVYSCLCADFLMTMDVDGYPRGDDTLDMQAWSPLISFNSFILAFI